MPKIRNSICIVHGEKLPFPETVSEDKVIEDKIENPLKISEAPCLPKNDIDVSILEDKMENSISFLEDKVDSINRINSLLQEQIKAEKELHKSHIKNIQKTFSKMISDMDKRHENDYEFQNNNIDYIMNRLKELESPKEKIIEKPLKIEKSIQTEPIIQPEIFDNKIDQDSNLDVLKEEILNEEVKKEEIEPNNIIGSRKVLKTIKQSKISDRLSRGIPSRLTDSLKKKSMILSRKERMSKKQ
jgi:hypothetical protein